MLLPNSPVRKIYECPNCGDVSVYFYDPKYNRAYSKNEWGNIVTDGIEALRKLIKPVHENPAFFTD